MGEDGVLYNVVNRCVYYASQFSFPCIAKKVPRVYHKDYYFQSPAAACALIQDANAHLPACSKNTPLNPQFLAKLGGGKAPLCSFSLVLLFSSHAMELQLGEE